MGYDKMHEEGGCLLKYLFLGGGSRYGKLIAFFLQN